MSKQIFFKGTFILTCAGLMSRVIGFFYRIFLSHTIGAQGLGLYQLIMPLQNLVLAFTVSGIQTSLSRLIASRLALKKEPDARKIFCTGTFMSFSLSSFAAWILYFNASFFAVQILKEPLTESLIKIFSFQFPLIALHSCINSYYFAEKKNRSSLRSPAYGTDHPSKLLLDSVSDLSFKKYSCHCCYCCRRISYF